MFALFGRFLMKNFPAFLSLAISLLTFLSFGSFLITSFHVRPLWKLLLTSKVLHLLDQALSSILSRWSGHCSLFLSCKHFLILFSFSLILISFVEILSSGLVLHIHVTIFASFLSTLITSFSLTLLQWIYFLLRVQAREGGGNPPPRDFWATIYGMKLKLVTVIVLDKWWRFMTSSWSHNLCSIWMPVIKLYLKS